MSLFYRMVLKVAVLYDPVNTRWYWEVTGNYLIVFRLSDVERPQLGKLDRSGFKSVLPLPSYGTWEHI